METIRRVSMHVYGTSGNYALKVDVWGRAGGPPILSETYDALVGPELTDVVSAVLEATRPGDEVCADGSVQPSMFGE